MKEITQIFLFSLIFIASCKNQCEIQSSNRPSGDTSRVYLYGEIYDITTKEKMPNTTLYIEGTKIATMADPNGKFKLDITTVADTAKSFRFVCRYISYQISHVTIKSKLVKSTKLNFEMIGSEGNNYTTYKMDRKTCTLKLINRSINEAPPNY